MLNLCLFAVTSEFKWKGKVGRRKEKEKQEREEERKTRKNGVKGEIEGGDEKQRENVTENQGKRK